MKRSSWILLAILITFAGWTTAGLLWAQRKGKPKLTEVLAGVIPAEFGELVSVSGDANSTTLAFRRANNDILVVKMRGNKLPSQVALVKRSAK